MSTFSGVTKRLLLCFLGGLTSGIVSLGVPCGDRNRFKVDALGGVSPPKLFPSGLRSGIGSGGISVEALTTMLGGGEGSPLALLAPFGPPAGYRLSGAAAPAETVDEDEPADGVDVWMLWREVTAGDAAVDEDEDEEFVLNVLAFEDDTPGGFLAGGGGGIDPG